MPQGFTYRGENYTAYRVTEEQLLEIRKDKGNPVLIQVCGHEGYLRHSTLGYLHVAHKIADIECSKATAPESEAHISAKMIALEAAIDSGWNGNLEVSGESRNWRADVLAEKDGYRVAIEIQLSPISHTQYLERTKRYAEDGVRPIWITRQKGFPEYCDPSIDLYGDLSSEEGVFFFPNGVTLRNLVKSRLQDVLSGKYDQDIADRLAKNEARARREEYERLEQERLARDHERSLQEAKARAEEQARIEKEEAERKAEADRKLRERLREEARERENKVRREEQLARENLDILDPRYGDNVYSSLFAYLAEEFEPLIDRLVNDATVTVILRDGPKGTLSVTPAGNPVMSCNGESIYLFDALLFCPGATVRPMAIGCLSNTETGKYLRVSPIGKCEAVEIDKYGLPVTVPVIKDFTPQKALRSEDEDGNIQVTYIPRTRI